MLDVVLLFGFKTFLFCHLLMFFTDKLHE